MSVKIQFEKGPAKPKRRVLRFTEPAYEPPTPKTNWTLIVGIFSAICFIIAFSIGPSQSAMQQQINALEKKQEHDAWKAQQKREQLLFDLYGRDWYKYK